MHNNPYLCRTIIENRLCHEEGFVDAYFACFYELWFMGTNPKRLL